MNVNIYKDYIKDISMNTIEQVKAEFVRTGQTREQWALKHGFTAGLVRAVLSGQTKNIRGDSHKIAVLLGMKEGEIVS